MLTRRGLFRLLGGLAMCSLRGPVTAFATEATLPTLVGSGAGEELSRHMNEQLVEPGPVYCLHPDVHLDQNGVVHFGNGYMHISAFRTFWDTEEQADWAEEELRSRPRVWYEN